MYKRQDIALRGRQYTVENRYLARDLSTSGCCPKAWQRTDRGFRLLKDGSGDAVERELLASRICRCFDVSQVIYEEDFFDGQKVTVSDNITSKEYSIASMEAFTVFLQNRGKDVAESILKLDAYNYYMMNIIDYLTGNTDRHWGNWGVLVDNENNKALCLHKLMDFNQAFHAYDTMEGANALSLFRAGVTQQEAAAEAVRAIGLNQIKEIPEDIFVSLPQYREMFLRRLEYLKGQVEKG